MTFNMPIVAIIFLLSIGTIIMLWNLSNCGITGPVTGGLYFFLLFIMGLSYEMSDYIAYTDMYNYSTYFQFSNIWDGKAYVIYGYSNDIGYTLLNAISFNFGFSYAQYKFVTSAFFLSIIFWILRKISGSERAILLVVSLYIVYPFFINVIQVRNFYVETILLLAMYVYTKAGRLKSIKFVLLLIVGATFHPIALIYIPFIVVAKLKGKIWFNKIYKSLFIIGLALPLYWSMVTTNMNSVFDILMGTEGNGVYNLAHYASYVEGKSMQYSWMVSYGFIVTATFILHKLNQQVVFLDVNASIKQRYLKNVYEFFKYLCLLLPVFPLGSSLERIPQNGMLMLYLCVVISFPYIHRQSDRFGIWCACFFLALFSGMAGLYKIGEGDNVLAILSNNYLIDYLIPTCFL